MFTPRDIRYFMWSPVSLKLSGESPRERKWNKSNTTKTFLHDLILKAAAPVISDYFTMWMGI